MKRCGKGFRGIGTGEGRLASGAAVRFLPALLLALPTSGAFAQGEGATGAFAQGEGATGAALAPYLGMLGAIVLQGLLMSVAVRDRGQPGLLLLASGILLALLSTGGLADSQSLPAWTPLVLQAGPALGGIGAAVFARSFLATVTNAPRLDRALKLSAFLSATALLVAPAMPSWLGPYTGAALGGAVMLLAVIAGLHLRPRRIPGIDLFLLGSASMLLGLAVTGARGLGLIPAGALAGHAAAGALVLGLVLLSVAQAGRSIVRYQRLAERRAQELAAGELQLGTLQQAEQLLTQQLSQRKRELEAAHQRMQGKEQGLRAAALYDPLTGLANALLLSDRITQGIARSKRHNCRTAVLFVGLDDFETVLDRAGDAIGGEVLKMAAQRLRGLVRDEDTVARPGSGEFALVLADVFEPQDVQRVASEAARQLGHVFRVDGHAILLSASVGCAIYPEDGGDAAALMRRAEKLMFPSRDGRSRAGAPAAGERASETAC